MKKLMAVILMVILMTSVLTACGSGHKLSKTTRHTANGIEYTYYCDGVEIGPNVYAELGGK